MMREPTDVQRDVQRFEMFLYRLADALGPAGPTSTTLDTILARAELERRRRTDREGTTP